MSRRVAILLAGTAMAVLMVAVAGMAWAQDGGNEPPSEPPPGAPTVVSTVPTDGKTGVDRDKNIKAKFSEKVKPATVKVLLYQGNLSYDEVNPDPTLAQPPPFPATVNYKAKTRTATLNPSVRLAKRGTYTAVVEGAGDFDDKAVQDRAGNEMARDKIWHFRTGRR